MQNGLPVLYDHINAYNSQKNPGTVHASNTGLQLFFQRYLMQKVMSVYRFQLPAEWDSDYFRYVLFTLGFIGVMNTDKYGVICQHGTVSGYNIYYRPTKMIIANPAFNKTYNLTIGEDCEVIRMAPDWRGAYDVVQMYADQMAVIMEAFGVNAINSKFAFVFAAENKTAAESMKKMYDQVASGQPAAFPDKKLFDENGNPKWQLFINNLKQNYIGNDLLQSLTTIENKFNTVIGINNANTQKRERLITDEVNANNSDTKALCSLWLDEMKATMSKANDMFGLSLDVNFNKEVSGNDAVISQGAMEVE